MRRKTFVSGKKAVAFFLALLIAITGISFVQGVVVAADGVQAADDVQEPDSPVLQLAGGTFRVETPGYFHRNPFPKQGPDFLVLDVTIADGAISGIAVVSHLERAEPMGPRLGDTRTGTPWLYVSEPADSPWWDNFIGLNTVEAVRAVPDVEGALYTSQAFKDAISTALEMAADVYVPQVFFAEGSGTAADPFIIGTVAELQALSNVVNHEDVTIVATYNAAHFRLANDINLAGINWVPIGCNTTANNRFRGTFDGGGHTIYNLTIRYEHEVPVTGGFVGVGLFGVFGINATFLNLGLVNVDIEADLMFQGAGHNAAIGVGALLGSSLNGGVAPHFVKVDRVFATGNIRVTNDTDPERDGNINNANIMVGGLVGCIAGMRSSITNSWADVDIYARSPNTAVVAGGLFGVAGHAGSHTSAELVFFGANNAAFGNISAHGGLSGKASVRAAAGGLGGTVNGVIYNSFAMGNVTANGQQVGLLAGRVNRGILHEVFYNNDAVLTRYLLEGAPADGVWTPVTDPAENRGVGWVLNVNAPAYAGAENSPRPGGVLLAVEGLPEVVMASGAIRAFLNLNLEPEAFNFLNELMLSPLVLLPSPYGVFNNVTAGSVADYTARIDNNWQPWNLISGKLIPAYVPIQHPGPLPIDVEPEPLPIDVEPDLLPESAPESLPVEFVPDVIVGLATTERLVSVIPPSPVAGQPLQYTVQPGENLWGIAFNYYGSSQPAIINRIIAANPGVIPPGGAVTAGMVITLPAQGLLEPIMFEHLDNAAGVYLVRPGDTLRNIATHFFGDSSLWREIRAANSPRVGVDNMIFVGQWLIIPQL